MWQGPHTKRPGSVVALGTEMRVLAEASLVQKDRRACMCSLRCDSPMVEELRGCLGLQQIAALP
jgi:hypothetical protein